MTHPKALCDRRSSCDLRSGSNWVVGIFLAIGMAGCVSPGSNGQRVQPIRVGGWYEGSVDADTKAAAAFAVGGLGRLVPA
ncbi:MAG: hypothetical protein CGW95_11060 [Phenylobacterium zucineum]|nr:MAG: hypothetical protein CGW95_11060 [Phenylobacterium zucineum]